MWGARDVDGCCGQYQYGARDADGGDARGIAAAKHGTRGQESLVRRLCAAALVTISFAFCGRSLRVLVCISSDVVLII